MHIVSSTHLEDCLNGSRWMRYDFDEPWADDEVRALGTLGSLDYFTEFPRPYFRLRSATGFEVKGVVGTTTCRALLPRNDGDVSKRDFEALFTADDTPEGR